MNASKHRILACLSSIERESPLFFGDMPLAEDAVREAMASSVSALYASNGWRRATGERRELSLLATLTHLMLETACLRYQLHGCQEAAAGEAARLIAKAAA